MYLTCFRVCVLPDLQDAVLSNQTASNLRASLAAKPVAARGLQRRLAAASPAGQLVLFSSIAGLLGSGGQASYATANSALDALADSWQQQVGSAAGGLSPASSCPS